MNATRLTIEGVGPDEITTSFLGQVLVAAEHEELAVTGVSIDWPDSGGDASDDSA